MEKAILIWTAQYGSEEQIAKIVIPDECDWQTEKMYGLEIGGTTIPVWIAEVSDDEEESVWVLPMKGDVPDERISAYIDEIYSFKSLEKLLEEK